MTVGAITAQLRLDMTNFREGLAKANSLLEQSGAAALRASALLAGFGAATAGGMAVAVRASAEFEAEMRNVNSILKESEPAFRALSDSVLALSGKVGQAPQVLARGLYDIASSGFKGAEGLRVLEASAVAATAGVSDTATASRAITAVLNAYGKSADEAGQVSDVLFKTVERGVITFAELAQNIGDVISTAAQARVPIEQVGAAIATMTRAGVQPAEAVTSLNQVLLSFIRPTDEAKKAASKLGIELSATNLAAKGLAGVVQEMGAALKVSAADLDAMQQAGASEAEIMAEVARQAGLTTESLAKLFPNVRALRGALVLASQGGREFAGDVEAMAEATGASAAAFAEQSKSLQVQWAKTRAAMQAFAVEVGSAFLPVLKAVAEVLKTVVQMGEAIPAPLRTALAVVILLAAGFASLTAAFIIYNVHMKEAVVLSGGFTGAMRQMMASMAAANVQISLTGLSLGKLAASAKAAGAAMLTSLRGGALGAAAITVGIGLLYQQFAEADRKGKDLVHTLIDLDKRAFKAKVRLESIKPPSFWSRMMEWAGYRTRDMDRFYKQLSDYRQNVESAEKAQANLAAQTDKLKQIERDLAEFRGTAHAQRMKEIADEEKALLMDLAEAGVKPEEARAQAARWAAAARAAASRDASREIEEAEIKLLELQGKTHEARMRQIEAEAQAIKQKYLAAQKDDKDTTGAAEAARRYRLAAIAAYERERKDLILHTEERVVEALVGQEHEIAGARERIHAVRMQQIEAEAQAIRRELIGAGLDAAKAEQAAQQYRQAALAAYEQKRRDLILDAEQRLVQALIGHEDEIAGARERIHRARLQQVQSEADAIRNQLISAGEDVARADLAWREYVAAKSAEITRQEAKQRTPLFQQSAEEIVSSWISAVEAMRQADRLQTGEYLQQLTRVLDLIRQVNAARAEAGQSRLFQQEELRLAQTISAERQRMQSEQADAEKRLADARKGWVQEELDQRRRLHEYELSLIDLAFRHRRDLAMAAGEDDEETLSRIAADELAALRARREQEQLTAQERLDSLERERQLILEMAQAGEMPETAVSEALEATFAELERAKEKLAEQDRTAFEERRQQHEETVKQIEGEQRTIRQQLSQTGGHILKVARQVFDGLQQRLETLGSVQLQPALAGAGLAAAGVAPGARTYNFYIGSRQVTAGADVSRIADQLADMLEREHAYARD
jgi:TP901 family phage tail tape measure protein